MPKAKQPPGEPMDLANMRSLGVPGLAVKCLQPACLHAAIVSVDDYPDDMLVRDFAKRWYAPSAARGGDTLTYGLTGWSNRSAARLPPRCSANATLACRYPQASRRTSRRPSDVASGRLKTMRSKTRP